jgi:hypothetical protein
MIPPDECEFGDLIHKNLKKNLITFCRQNQPACKKILNRWKPPGELLLFGEVPVFHTK